MKMTSPLTSALLSGKCDMTEEIQPHISLAGNGGQIDRRL
jgi:hypothetical protein